MPNRLSRLLTAASLLVLVGCDHGSKEWAQDELAAGQSRQVVPGLLDLTYAESHDIAFNALRWIPHETRQVLMGVLGPVSLLLLSAFAWRAWPRFSRVQRIAVVAMLAGAIGNVADRLARGYVIDFIRLPHWPIFNLADIYLCVGLAMFAWLAIEDRAKWHRNTT